MNIHDALYEKMIAAGLPEDSSTELAFHISLHYPEHGVAILGVQPDPAPEEPSDPGSGEPTP